MPTVAGFDVDKLLEHVMNVGSPGGRFTSNVSELDLIICCQEARQAFMTQSMMVEIDPPVVVVGDIHGQFVDLLEIFDKEGFPPKTNYLFLGDYVDRGSYNLETIVMLFCYKIKYPENFFLLRGNHECASVNRVYGFYDEVQRRYNSARVWRVFQDTFTYLPLTGLIGGRILCMHGGLSPNIKRLDDFRNLQRFFDPKRDSTEIDIIWSDPDPWVKGWEDSVRGVSFVFGQDVVVGMCMKLGIDLIARAHQVVQDGYEFFANRRLVTIFSAPNYCGEFDNCGATMQVDANMKCTFTTYVPKTRQKTLPPGQHKTQSAMLQALLDKNPSARLQEQPQQSQK